MSASHITSVVFLDDILRTDWWPAKEFFYDIISSCLQFQPDIQIKSSFRDIPNADDHSIKEALYKIYQQYHAPEDQRDWVNAYDALPEWVQNFVQDQVRGVSLVVGYELPEALRAFLSAHAIDYIDFRISPIRFCTDLMISFYSNNAQIMAAAAALSIPKQEVQHEANLRRASFLHRYRYAPQPFETAPDIVYFGQTPFDTSIVRNGEYVRLPEFMAELEVLKPKQTILYKKHPDAAQEFAQTEINCFKAMGFSVIQETRNSYDVLCMPNDFEIMALSSSVAFEAPFFGRKVKTLLPAPSWVKFTGDAHAAGYYQLSFDMFSHPQFWHAALAGGDLPMRKSLWDVQPDRLRKLHNVWWAYAEHVAPNDHYIWMAKNEFYSHIHGHEVRLNGIDEAIQGIDKNTQAAHTSIHCIFDDIRHTQAALLRLVDLDKYPFSKALFEQLSGTKWQFGSNSALLCSDYFIKVDGRTEGVWYVNAQQEVIAIWAMGRFIDRLQLSSDAQQLVGFNILGHKILANRTVV